MLQERNVIYFSPFYFPDGKSAPKEKYFIVLKNNNNANILASLPTRKDSVPYAFDDTNGCISIKAEEHGFNLVCYRIEAGVEILEANSFTFDFDTHIYGTNLKLYEIEYFKLYPHEGIDYTVIGKLKQEVYDDLINCLKENNSVKRGYRRMLGAS